jgi:outer membrane protein assembly factor BamA
MNLEKPTRINRITISGPSRRTQDAYFERQLESVLHQRLPLQLLDAELRKVYTNLISSGNFEVVNMKLEVDKDSGGPYNSHLHIFVKEKGMPFLKLESFVQSSGKAAGNDVGLAAQGALRNPFGYGESFQLSIGGSSQGTKDNVISARFPHTFIRDHILQVSGKTLESNTAYYTSFNQKSYSLFGDLFSKDLQRNLSAEISVRDEIPLKHDKVAHAYSASLPIMNMIAPSTKLSLKYNHSYDSRDSPLLPTKGVYAAGSIEVALPPGDAQFVRADVSFQDNILLKSFLSNPADGLVLSVAASCGLIHPLQASFHQLFNRIFRASDEVMPLEPPVNRIFATDRYQAGGPMNLRGLSIYGIGPRANAAAAGGYEAGDSIGGLVKSNVSAGVSCPLRLPWPGLHDARGFLFLNCGALGKGEWSSTRNYLGSPRLSIGSGFAINLSNAARLEVSYAMPLLYAKHDLSKPFQIGVGLSLI